MFHKEGYQIILTSFLIAALIAIGSEYKIDNFILRTVFQIFSLRLTAKNSTKWSFSKYLYSFVGLNEMY